MKMKSILFAAVLFARTQVFMGDIPVTLTIEASESKRIAAFSAMEEAFDRAKSIEQEVSEFIPTSQTSRLNRLAGKEWVPIGRHLLQILETGRSVSILTDGAFDVTFASKNKEAGFHDILITQAGEGEQRWQVKLKYPYDRITVSGLAKGYIVDRMADVLKEAGFKKFLINAGGEILARGRWPVAIRDPQDPDGEPVLSLNIKNRAVSTSGLYERGNHIFDAETGKPVNRTGSVTVIAKNSSTADAWDTAAFIMGREKLLRSAYKSATPIRMKCAEEYHPDMRGSVETICRKIPDVEFIFLAPDVTAQTP